MTPSPELDIVIPVYNEGENIAPLLDSLKRGVKTPFRVLICYDRDDDNTLTALKGYPIQGFQLVCVKNCGRGALGAVLTGFTDSTAPAVLVYPADDDYNAPKIDLLMAKFHDQCEIVAASRFMRGGSMRDCPWLKALLVRSAAFVMHTIARVPTHDATNGLRLFSRRVLQQIPIESQVGFAFSIELLVKCHRLRWKIGEVPFDWQERKSGKSRFRTVRWVPQYSVWLFYALATTWLRRPARTVVLRTQISSPRA
ncbi:MAG: glycosyltransferase [Verrucomicrobia bacterium]|nr:glycosyltransferase [Verrucomicrobiota bacterium]